MVIKELAEYYDLLYSQGKIISPDFEEVPITYLVVLTPDGRIEILFTWASGVEIGIPDVRVNAVVRALYMSIGSRNCTICQKSRLNFRCPLRGLRE